MSAIPSIKQGESFPFVFDLNGEDISGWILTIFVKQFPSETAIISREIEADSETRAWPGFLTQTETSALPVSSTTPFYLIGKFQNILTDQEIQSPERFNVTPVWA